MATFYLTDACGNTYLLPNSDVPVNYPTLLNENLSGADLSTDPSNVGIPADLSGATVNSANLSGANLSGVNLTNAFLSDADLSGVNLSGATLTGATLIGNVLTGANISSVDFSTVLSSGGIITDSSIPVTVDGGTVLFTPSYEIVDGAIVGENTVIFNTNLTGDLTGIDFTGIHSTNVTNLGAILPANVIVYNGRIIANSVNYHNVDLTGINFGGITLLNTILTNSNLTNAIMDVSNIQFVEFPGSTFNGAVFSDFNSGSVSFVGANLTGADLTGASGGGIHPIDGAGVILPAGWSIVGGEFVYTTPSSQVRPIINTGSGLMNYLINHSNKVITKQKKFSSASEYLLKLKGKRTFR